MNRGHWTRLLRQNPRAWHLRPGGWSPKSHNRARSCPHCAANGPRVGCTLPFRKVRPVRYIRSLWLREELRERRTRRRGKDNWR